MAPAPPLPPSPRRAQRPGRGNGAGAGSSGQEVRALCVPYTGDTCGLSRLITVSQNRCSTALSCACHVVPKLVIKSCASGGPGSGIAQGWAREWRVTSCAGIPPRRRRTCSRPGVGVHVVQPSGAPHGPLPLARSNAYRRRDGTPAHAPSCPEAGHHPVRPVILVRAPRVPVHRGTHGEPRTTTVRISLTTHQNTSLLTPRDGPLLCKAVLRPCLNHAIGQRPVHS
jgi:hypothetical protein